MPCFSARAAGDRIDEGDAHLIQTYFDRFVFNLGGALEEGESPAYRIALRRLW
jgi:hypothetical protein